MSSEELELKKKYLRKYESAKRQQERIEDELEMIRQERILPGITADGMPHGSKSKNDLADYVSRLDEIECEWIQAKQKKIEIRNEIMQKINELESENEKDVLIARYIDIYDWKVICIKLNYGWAQTHRIHASALKNIKI